MAARDRPVASDRLRWACLVVAVEAVALVGLGAYVAVRPAIGTVGSVAITEAEAGITAAVGLVLLWLARALVRSRRWARSPVVLVQLLAVPVGIGLAQGHQTLAGAVVLVLAVAVLGLLATRAARAPFEPPGA